MNEMIIVMKEKWQYENEMKWNSNNERNIDKY